MNKSSKKSHLLCLTAFFVSISLFAAITFEAFHTNHQAACHEENCPICLLLQIIHNTEKIGQTAASASVEFIYSYYINLIILSALLLTPATLVKQKVKLVI